MKNDQTDLILPYLRGNLSPEERDRFESWRNESDENRKMVDDFLRIWQESGDKNPPTDFDSEYEWKKFESSAFREQTPARERTLIQEPWLRIAAAILLIGVSSFAIYQTIFKSEFQVIEARTENIQTTLPDGSTVWLHAESRLTYDKDFNHNRMLTLEGEAFFQVTKDSEHPFSIRTHAVVIEVLGTSFNVKAYEREPVTEVFVQTGKVSVEVINTDAKAVLTPGMTAALSHQDGQLNIQTEEDPNRLAWRNKELVFKKSPLKSVLRTLSSYFRKDFRAVNDDLLNCRFTGSFKDPTLDEVLESLNLALDLKLSQRDGIYYLDGIGCKQH